MNTSINQQITNKRAHCRESAQETTMCVCSRDNGNHAPPLAARGCGVAGDGRGLQHDQQTPTKLESCGSKARTNGRKRRRKVARDPTRLVVRNVCYTMLRRFGLLCRVRNVCFYLSAGIARDECADSGPSPRLKRGSPGCLPK